MFTRQYRRREKERARTGVRAHIHTQIADKGKRKSEGENTGFPIFANSMLIMYLYVEYSHILFVVGSGHERDGIMVRQTGSSE